MSDGANRIRAMIEKKQRLTLGTRVVAIRDHSTGGTGPEFRHYYFAGWRGTVQPEPDDALGVSFVLIRWDVRRDDPDSTVVDIDNAWCNYSSSPIWSTTFSNSTQLIRCTNRTPRANRNVQASEKQRGVALRNGPRFGAYPHVTRRRPGRW